MPRSSDAPTAEHLRLRQNAERTHNWQRWGPYLAERQWGTVREDYSATGDAWSYFPHDDAPRRAYRWGEDGLLGLCDRQGRLCFALALWNERDPMLKERLFGLAGPEGNHGEDVKECYFYLDSTPTHSWMRALYKYPQAAFPYARLREENRRRGRLDPEYEILDTRVFDDQRYFDVFVDYAKAAPEDLLIRLRVINRGPDAAPLHLLPTWWFRNTWSWGCRHEGCARKPSLRQIGPGAARAEHETLGSYVCEVEDREAPWLFTENESDVATLFGGSNASPYVKDAFHQRVVHGRAEAVNPAGQGTKAAPWVRWLLAPGEERVLRLRFYAGDRPRAGAFGGGFDDVMDKRLHEADAFHASVPRRPREPEAAAVARQAYAGLLWTKQFYHYIVEDWLEGDPGQPRPPTERRSGRNADWRHVYNRDVLSMPDKWEYPWFAAWDTAFHMLPMAHVDPEFAKDQMNLFLREWYLHPNGQIPAYEWNLGDVNPPVHAWACWRVYKLTGRRGERDRVFLARTFQKLLVNFTWWVNRKDPEGNHLFAGGFLGLDNIGLFDRSKPLPTGGRLTQADGTAWMAFYCTTMMAMALELAETQPEYEDIASKFFEHFVAIADAMNAPRGGGLWHEEDGFYYDQLLLPHGETEAMRVRSLVGLVPLLAAEVIEDDVFTRLPGFAKRTRWFLENRRDLAATVAYLEADGGRRGRHLLAVPKRARLERVLRRLFDETAFLSPHGIRSLSKEHAAEPYRLRANGDLFEIGYVPGDSDSGLFGGNSNWRGPIWFPLNYLLIEALERYHHFYGDALRVEVPTGSGRWMTLREAAGELSRRLASLFQRGPDGQRPADGPDRRWADDPHWRDLHWFHEFFHGDDGRGLGASHQTGWTSLVVRLLQPSPPSGEA